MSEYYFRIAELIHKVRVGIIDEEEQAELERWLEENETHRAIYEQMMGRLKVEETCRAYQSVSTETVWKRIKRLGQQRKQRQLLRWSMAAAAIVVLSWGILLWTGQQRAVELPVAQKMTFDSIRSGERKAILQLADGQKILLHDKEIQLQTEGVAIRQENNELKYIADSLPLIEKKNVLTIPRGGEFNVTLSDGTRVWLNAGSQLIFPEVFVKNTRVVELSGEAYFEVAENAEKPFVVKTKEVDVRVLGTHFNVKAFAEEGRTVTTLAEGSVELQAGNRKIVLEPDQQGEYFSGTQGFKVHPVDAADAIAWKDGKFVFRRERLETIMESVARWYNLEVTYQNPQVRDILFSGKMDRYGNVRELLDMIEKTEKVKFELNNQGLMVREK